MTRESSTARSLGFFDRPELHGRTMLVRKADMLPIECIVRGRLAGQAYDEYVSEGTVHHMPAPDGLRLTDPFPEPIFTPSTKAESGHDQNIDLASAAKIVGDVRLEEAQALCLDLFARAASKLEAVGLVLADTKFELGLVDDELVVCDEVLTPDSSRIWPADEVRPGEVPPAFDKQPFRDWLTAMKWDRTPPPPRVPEEIVHETSSRYVAAYERVTGHSLRRMVRFFSVNYSVVVDVTLREGIADPEGATIERALPALGFNGVSDVKAGKSFRMTIDAVTETDALERATALAERLLSNPVIEDATARLVGSLMRRVGVVVFPGSNCEYDAACGRERARRDRRVRLALVDRCRGI